MRGLPFIPFLYLMTPYSFSSNSPSFTPEKNSPFVYYYYGSCDKLSKTWSLKNTDLLSYCSQVRSPNSVSETKSHTSRLCSFSGSRENPSPCFPLLDAACTPWLVALFHLQSQQCSIFSLLSDLCFHSHISFLSDFVLPHSYKDPWNYTGPTQIMQDDLQI